MKKKMVVALSVLFASLLFVACGKSDTPPQTSTPAPEASAEAPKAPNLPTQITIGLDDNFPPMGFRDDKSELVGFDIDLAKEVGRRLGIEVIFKAIDWNAKEVELNGKRVDVLWNGLTITEARKEKILFTTPYLENHQIIIVKTESPITTKAGLANKVVGVQDGSSAIEALQKDEAVAKSLKELKKFSDNVTALMDVSIGRLDALVVDEVVGRYYVAKKPDEYRVLDENFGTEDYGVGTRKEDTDLMSLLQKVMDEMKADGSAAAISTKWFGRDIIKR